MDDSFSDVRKKFIKTVIGAFLVVSTCDVHARGSENKTDIALALLLELGLETTPARKIEDGRDRDTLLEGRPSLGIGVKVFNPWLVASVIPKIGFSGVGVSLDPADSGAFRSLRLGVESLLHLSVSESHRGVETLILGMDYNLNKVRGESNYKDASIKLGVGAPMRDLSPFLVVGLALKIGRVFYDEGAKNTAGVVFQIHM